MMTFSYTKAAAEHHLSNFKFNILTAPGFLVLRRKQFSTEDSKVSLFISWIPRWTEIVGKPLKV